MFFTLNIFAASPSNPILPSDNIQDPGDVTTPWGGCGPTDSNCYIQLTSFTNETVTGLDYSTSTGVLSLSSGYVIPLVASTTAWDNAVVSNSFSTSTSRNILSSIATGLTYSTTTGIFQLEAGYIIPTQTQLDNKQDQIATGTISQYLRGDLSLATFPTALSEFTNDANFISDLTSFTTDNLTQGSTNLYSQWGTSGSNVFYTGGNVGIGTTTPVSKLNVLSTTEQLRLNYDSSNYLSSTINSTGIATLNTVGTAPGFSFTGGNVGIGVIPDVSASNRPALQIIKSGVISQLFIGNSVTNSVNKTASLGIAHYNSGWVAFDAIYGSSNSTANVLTFGGGGSGAAATGISFNTAANSTTVGGTTRMTIDSSGNVGVGTTTPTQALTVFGTVLVSSSTAQFQSPSGTASAPGFSFKDSTNMGMYRVNGNGMGIAVNGSNVLTIDISSNIYTNGRFQTGNGSVSSTNFGHVSAANTGLYLTSTTAGLSISGTAALHIDSSRNIGVGTSTPVGKLDIVSNSATTKALILKSFTGSSVSTLEVQNSLGAVVAAIGPTGNISAGDLGSYSGQIHGITGSASVPTFSFNSDVNTGIYNVSEDTIGFTSGGTLRFSVSPSGLTSTVSMYGASGSVSVPGYTFGSDVNTGMYSAGSDILGFSTGGTNRLVIDASGNVGIGTTTPTQQLSITGNFQLPTSTSSAGIFYSGGDTYIHNFGTSNFFAGSQAGNLTLSGAENTGIGYQSLLGLTSGAGNMALGFGALKTLSTGDHNTAMGRQALTSLTTGSRNTSIGRNTLTALTGAGALNTAIGDLALTAAINGVANTAIGAQALQLNVPASNAQGYNTAIGYAAGGAITTGQRNIMIGSLTGFTGTLATGNDMIAIGYNVHTTASNQINIGNTLYGDISTGNVSIGRATTSDRFEVYGTTSGKGLRVDGGGNGSYLWLAGGNQALSTVNKAGIVVANGNFSRGNMYFLLDSSSDSNNANITDDTKMMIDYATGNVGIGTSTPVSRLSIGSGQIEVPVGSAAAPSYTFSGFTNQGMYSPSTNILAFSQGGAVRFQVFTAGVESSAQVRGAGGSASVPTFVGSGDTNTGIFFLNNDILGLSTGGSERLRVDASGNVGIGTTTPADKLQVFGDIRIGMAGSDGCIKDYAGTGIVGVCSSDERLKTNIVDLSDGYLDKLVNLKVITYNWNEEANQLNKVDTTVTNYGLLAQNVESIFPELVTTDSKGYKQVNYSRLPLYLLKSVQELSKKVIGFADEFRTKKLCVGDTCIDENQLKVLLQNQNIQTVVVPTPTPTPTPEPITETPTDPTETESDDEIETPPTPEVVTEPEPVVETPPASPVVEAPVE